MPFTLVPRNIKVKLAYITPFFFGWTEMSVPAVAISFLILIGVI